MTDPLVSTSSYVERIAGLIGERITALDVPVYVREIPTQPQRPFIHLVEASWAPDPEPGLAWDTRTSIEIVVTSVGETSGQACALADQVHEILLARTVAGEFVSPLSLDGVVVVDRSGTLGPYTSSPLPQRAGQYVITLAR